MEPEAALREALAAFQRRDFDRAEALLAREAAPLARTPGPAQRSFYMARARLTLLHDLFAEGDALAGAAERTVLRRDEDPPAWAAARSLRAEIALVAGDPDQAERLLPDDVPAPLLRGQIAFERGDLDVARSLVAQADPGLETTLTRARILGAIGDDWRPLLEGLGDDARIAGVRTRLALKDRDLAAARAWLARTDREQPFIPTPITRRGFTTIVSARCLTATGKPDEARPLLLPFIAAADARPLCAVDALLALAEAGDPDARARAVNLAHGLRGPFHEYAYPEPPR